MTRKRNSSSPQVWILLVISALLLGCPQAGPIERGPFSYLLTPASDAAPDGAKPTQISRVAIRPSAFLLPGPGESTQLTATAYDADGYEVEAAIEWTTSDGAALSIDPSGLVTAGAATGSACITATAGGASKRVMGVIARPVAGATLVSDDQVVSEATPVDEAAEYGLGYRYRVTLSDLPEPAVGDLLLGTGALPVGGRVVEVTEDGENLIVTLEVVPPDELVEDLTVSQTIELNTADLEIPEEIAAAFDVSIDPNGTIWYVPVARATGKPFHRAQAADPTASSSMKLALSGTAGAGSSIKKLKDFFNLTFNNLSVTISLPLDQSPTGTFTITPDEVAPGDDQNVGELATFNTTLNQSTFLGVESVEYLWWKDNLLDPGRPPCTTLSAAPGQTTFECTADFTEDHLGEQTFYAFYHARLFGVLLPFPFEVAKDGKASVKVKLPERATFEVLGFPPDRPHGITRPTAVSADGSTVVGVYSYDSGGQNFEDEAFRWTKETGMVGLGFIDPEQTDPPDIRQVWSIATAVSAGGAVVIGASRNAAPGGGVRAEAFRWMNGSMHSLGFSPVINSIVYSGFGLSMTSDGGFIAGTARHEFRNEAFLWSNTHGITWLGFLSEPNPRTRATLIGVSDSGVVVGLIDDEENSPYTESFIWDDQRGMRSLVAELVNEYGLAELEDNRHVFVTGISAEGRVIVGIREVNPDRGIEGWRVVLRESP